MYILMYVRTPLAQPVIGPDKDAACARQPAAETAKSVQGRGTNGSTGRRGAAWERSGG
jgi:hypothetical protein